MVMALQQESGEALPPAAYAGEGFDLHQEQRMLQALEGMEDVHAAQDGGQATVSLAEQLAAAMAQAVGQMTVRMDGRTVGGIVAPTVSEAIARGAAARRYTV